MATEFRLNAIRDFEADQAALRQRQQDLETQLMAEPARTWQEAAIEAQYLIRRYAETAEAQDARRQKLIQRALGDLARLIEREDASDA